jgi:hypothetical protein
MKVALAVAAVAAVLFSTTVADAQGAKASNCAARCKAYCAKNYPGYPLCQDRCMTKQCNR